MTKKGASGIFVALLFFVAMPVINVVQQRQNSHAFDSINQGDSKEDVVLVLGQPDEVRICMDTLYWGGDHKRLGPNNGQCFEEFYYSSMPGGWSVGFSANNKVVSKYTYVSP